MRWLGVVVTPWLTVALGTSPGCSQEQTSTTEQLPTVYSDVAAVYYYGNGVTRIHTWINNGGAGFTYSGSNGWFSTNKGGYEANRLVKLACGDFDGNGLDDLAGFYYYGNGKTAIHVWLNSGQKRFEYKTSAGWWREEAGYDATRLVGVAAGDYNGDGFDDLCGFYNYGAGKVHLHVWLSDGVSTFKYQGSDGWWKVNTGYEAENIRHVVGGEFAP